MTSEIMPGGANEPIKRVAGAHHRARAARLARRAAQFNKFRLIQLNLVPLVDTFVSVVFFTLVTATVGELAPTLFADRQARKGLAVPWSNGKNGKEYRSTLGRKGDSNAPVPVEQD